MRRLRISLPFLRNGQFFVTSMFIALILMQQVLLMRMMTIVSHLEKMNL
jgi:hypothetical protein